MSDGRFEGWYYNQHTGDYMLAFIPGRAGDGAFVQMIDSNGARRFGMPDFHARGDTIRTGDCVFSPYGLRVRLPGVEGELRYGKTTPLRSDIMGPFSRLPMQCSHGVVSMNHTVDGCITVDGTPHFFDKGSGYAEKDRGRSFPRSYRWVQCNDFPVSCSLFFSEAHIPFLGFSFTGCICAVLYRGKEYRLATYRGVKILETDSERILLRQGNLSLELTVRPLSAGHSLKAPLSGKMTETIRESCDAFLHLRLTERGRTVVECESVHAAYEKR